MGCIVLSLLIEVNSSAGLQEGLGQVVDEVLFVVEIHMGITEGSLRR